MMISIIIWSASFIATKIAGQAFTPLVLCCVRTVIAAFILALIMLVKGSSFRIDKQDVRPVFLSGFFGVAVYYALENIGVSLTSAANASIITAVYPISTLLVGALFFHDRIRLPQLSGIMIAVIGIIILTGNPSSSSSLALKGDLLLVFNGFMWGLFNYLTQQVSPDTDNTTLTFYQTLVGAVLFIPLMFAEAPIVIGPLKPSVLTALLFLSAGCSVGAVYFYNLGLRGVSAGTAAAMLNLMPVFGMLFSYLLLNETITFRQIAGAAAVILGVLLSMKTELQKNE